MTAPKLTMPKMTHPIHLDLGTQVYKAMKLAFQVRHDNLESNDKPYALAHKMAGELGYAMFGLNTWSSEDAELCNKVHSVVMKYIASDIRAIEKTKLAIAKQKGSLCNG